MKSRYLYSTGLVLILLIIFSIGFSAINKVENFTLIDYSGKKHSLTDYKDSKAVVLMFIATRCPVSNAYNGRMASLYSDYKDKNITFLAINSNNTEDLDEIKKHAQDNGLMFPILKDENNVLADKFDAQVTPEIFVIDQKSNILYHGRIDDERRESDVKSADLRKALDEIIANKSVSVSETKAFGCSIKRVSK